MGELFMSDEQPDLSPAQRWYRLAEEDVAAAKVLLADSSTALRIVGFLSQQAVEKALKALLLELGVVPPKIHGLRQLKNQAPAASRPSIDDDDLDLLDPWVIDGRYAADLPDVDVAEASELLEAAQRIVQIVGETMDRRRSGS
jgi:HEPN domain-containing protein